MRPSAGSAPTSATPPSEGRALPSRAADFKQCPLKFRLRTIDRLDDAPSPAAARGTLVHAVLERLFDSPPPERTLDTAVALVALRDRIARGITDTIPVPPQEVSAPWLAISPPR